MKHVLLLAYEYPGYNSRSGAALARRVKQVADSFAGKGWAVTVVHKDQTGENTSSSFMVREESPLIKRISVRATKPDYAFFERSVLRRLFTLYVLLAKGDRTYRWAGEVKRQAPHFQLSPPDLIVSFFTPKGPLALGNHFSKKYNVPWIADLQDELDQGTLSSNKYFSRLNSSLSHVWFRNVLRSAKAVVQVSPEWAKMDSRILGKEIACIRHAIAAAATETATTDLYMQDMSSHFDVFYGGSVELENQELGTLNEVLLKARLARPVKLIIAGSEKTFSAFRTSIHEDIQVEYAGWLEAEAYSERIKQSHCCLIVPWSGKDRQVIPSKFYEVCAMRPVWIVGQDSGAFKTLFADLGHPLINCGNVELNVQALEKAVGGDHSGMFTLDKCSLSPVTDKTLSNSYLQLVSCNEF